MQRAVVLRAAAGREQQRQPQEQPGQPVATRALRCWDTGVTTKGRLMFDPITEELFRNAISAIGDEMVLTIYRTAYSGVLKNIMDYSAAICDADGRLVAQGLSLPGHLCSIPVALQAVLRHFQGDIAEGDIFINNDPYDGGMHLPDIFIFKPLFADGRPIAYAATICHHTDVGGRVPGSNASDSTEIYAEGLRIPPLKLYERGHPNATLFRMIERNVRLPARVL